MAVGDNRDDIREFLASRRARITPEQAGLPSFGGARRVTGLRRAEVAMLAGVSPDYYTRLERGNLSGVSDSVLDAVARALNLDDAERSHLHDLARAANTSPRTRRRPGKQQVRPGVRSLLDAMTDAPAFIRNGRLDILAINRLGQGVHPASAEPALAADPPEGGGCHLQPGRPQVVAILVGVESQGVKVEVRVRPAGARPALH